MTDKPAHLHDCPACIYLGQTIGGGRITDLYAHKSTYPGDISRDATLIARYGPEGEYYSAVAKNLDPILCHAELLVARELWSRLTKERY